MLERSRVIALVCSILTRPTLGISTVAPRSNRVAFTSFYPPVVSLPMFLCKKVLPFILTAWASCLHGAKAANLWITPPPSGRGKDYSQNPTYRVGDSLRLEWAMGFTDATLTLWSDSRPGDTGPGTGWQLTFLVRLA